MSKHILVPTSLSATTNTILNYAARTAKFIDNCSIILLSVVKDKKLYDKAEEHLKRQQKWLAMEFPEIEVVSIVKNGDVSKMIKTVADEFSVEYIYVKTNDSSIWGKIFGSSVLDIVSVAKQHRFIVIQKEVPYSAFKNIVVPIDTYTEISKKIVPIISLANHFKSTIHLFFTNEEEVDLQQKIDDNLLFAKRYLANNEVNTVIYKSQVSSEDPKSYFKDLIEYSKNISANLISAINFQTSFGLLSLPANNFENNLINNEFKIPVSIVNP